MFLLGGKWLVVIALVAVTGGHWFVLQSAAWVSMAVTYSRVDSFATALKKTFDGEHPCKLCKMVKAGKASEKKRDLQKLEAKFEFLTVAGTCGLFPPRPFRHFTPVNECASAREATPPAPPPRFA